MEAAPQVDWLHRQVLKLQVCMEILQTLAAHILSGLFLKNQPLRQPPQLVVHGTLQPM
jgi:hypothetical protein